MFKPLFILCGSVVLPAMFLWLAFDIWSSGTAVQPAIVVNIEADLARFEAELAGQEAIYQAELESLLQTLQQQQRDDETRQQALNSQITALRQQLAGLQQQKQTLQSQLTQLQATQAEQQSS